MYLINKLKEEAMDIRVMDGQAKSDDPTKGPRIVTRTAGKPKEQIRPDGSKFKKNESRKQRETESHIPLDKGGNREK